MTEIVSKSTHDLRGVQVSDTVGDREKDSLLRLPAKQLALFRLAIMIAL